MGGEGKQIPDWVGMGGGQSFGEPEWPFLVLVLRTLIVKLQEFR